MITYGIYSSGSLPLDLDMHLFLSDLTSLSMRDTAQIHLSIEKKQIHGHGEQTCNCQGRGGGSGMDWEFGVSRCKLLYFLCISNEVLLYSAGNYTSLL